jgi:hypothetical protein
VVDKPAVNARLTKVSPRLREEVRQMSKKKKGKKGKKKK